MEQRTAKVGAQVWVNATPIYTFEKPGSYMLGLPGLDMQLVIEAAVAVIDPYPGQAIEYVENGTKTIYAKSNTRYVSKTGRARVNADTGVKVSDRTENVSFTGIDFIGNGEKGDGVRMIAERCKNITFDDCGFRNFDTLITIHTAAMDGPDSEDNRDITIKRCRLLDAAGRDDKSGHGIFAMNVDGLTIEDNLIDGAGFASDKRTGWVHCIYSQHGNKRVVVRNNILSRGAGCGLQARGPQHKATDRDDEKDAGPSVVGNVFWDCQIAIMPNGPRATVRGNAIVTGHYTTKPDQTGEGGIYASVGKLDWGDNVRVSGPKVGSGYRIEGLFNRPRQVKDGWEWDKPCVTTGGEGNIDKLSVKVDLGDLLAQARNGSDISTIRQSMQDRIRRAVK